MGQAATTLPLLPDELRQELFRRRDLDQTARSAFAAEDREAIARLFQIDRDNAAWLRAVVDAVGWPGRSIVGDEGAHAAWLLAQHADGEPELQRRCLQLLEQAVALGEASPADLAHLTDRVLVASGELQLYGTQTTARDGRYVPCGLRDPDTVDARRASVCLEPLAAHLNHLLSLCGPPKPGRVPCPECSAPINVWMPEPGCAIGVVCPRCGAAVTIRASMPATRLRANS